MCFFWLCTENRQVVKPFVKFIYLFMCALSVCPKADELLLYRGVKFDTLAAKMVYKATMYHKRGPGIRYRHSQPPLKSFRFTNIYYTCSSIQSIEIVISINRSWPYTSKIHTYICVYIISISPDLTFVSIHRSWRRFADPQDFGLFSSYSQHQIMLE